MKKLLVCLLLLILPACGGGGGGDSSASNGCGTLNLRIFGGESCNQFGRSPVVALAPVATDGQVVFRFGTCTGTLVTLDDILTSAHCFLDPIILARNAGAEIIGFAVLVGGAGGEVLPIVDFQLHPLYDGSRGSRFDVAMATISRVPSPPIGPLPILLSEITGPGSPITAFGYGTNDQGVDDILKAADFTIEAIEGGNIFVVGNGSTSICPGDSGGPAVFVASDGTATLAGVNSFIDSLSGGCDSAAAIVSGFVDIQSIPILNFINDYAPDAAVK